MAKAEPEMPEPKPARTNGRFSGPKLVCPTNAEHRRVRVYKTSGRTRYCVCDDCTRTWKVVAEAAHPATTYLEALASRLESAASNPQPVAGQQVVVIGVEDARKTAAQLRSISNGLPTE